MTGLALLWLALFLVAAVADWIAVHLERKALEYVAKPAALVALIGAAAAIEVDDPAVKAWFLAALALCLLGDVLLMLPQDLFVFGLAAFLLGHVAYIVGMHVDGVDATRFLVGIVLVMIALAIIGTTILRAVRRGDEPGLAGPVVAYMFVISAMVASAIGTGNPAAIVGATSFYSSDALIAWNRFVHEQRYGHLAVMITYHLGQLGLVLSLV
jgi:uncharacterized membrane protein YhhN